MRGDTGTGAGGSEKPPEPPVPAGPGRTEPWTAERSVPVELSPGSERLTIAGQRLGTGCPHGGVRTGGSIQGVSARGVSAGPALSKPAPPPSPGRLLWNQMSQPCQLLFQ